MSETGARAAPTNVLIVGVGGQGVIMVSHVLALLCHRQGHTVKQSEVHGMAKRGGVVYSHVRYGAQVWSPTIPLGDADVVVALEWAEGLRWLHYLRPGHGTFIVDTQRIVPPFACLDRRPGAPLGYAGETVAEVVAKVENSYALDATDMAEEIGNLRVSNTLLLGVLSTVLDFPEDDWLEVIAQVVPPKSRELNRVAFLRGREWARHPPRLPEAPKAAVIDLEQARTRRFELRITAAWCKGCDICVKMCPERCLVLNADRVAELTDPDACTGCRICELLCPDLAIDVLREGSGL